MTTIDSTEKIEEEIDGIRSRASDFIDSGIWDGIALGGLEAWFNNFSGIEEQFVAAKLVESLVYRSEHQTIALAQQLFQRTLPDLLSYSEFEEYRPSWLELLSDKSYNVAQKYPIRIVPIIRDTDPPTKSGPNLARLYRRALGLNERLMIWPDRISDKLQSGCELFILIDDFLGTGDQFKKFYDKYDLVAVEAKAKVVYIPLAAHEIGLGNVRRECPSVLTNAAEILREEENNFFRAGTFGLYTSEIRSRYSSLVDKYLNVKPELKFGYGELGVTYAFQHATPNATLPLFWADGMNFRSLLRR